MDLESRLVHTGTWGNFSREAFVWETSAVADDAVEQLSRFPQGVEIHEIRAIVNDPANANVTLKLGYTLSAGDDDDDYFWDAEAISAQKVKSSVEDTYHEPLLIRDPDAYLVGTIEGAAINQATKIIFLVDYIFKGNL